MNPEPRLLSQACHKGEFALQITKPGVRYQRNPALAEKSCPSSTRSFRLRKYLHHARRINKSAFSGRTGFLHDMENPS